MYHSCRIWEGLYPGRQHGTDYCQCKSDGQKTGNHDFLWLLPFQLCVLEQLPMRIQNMNKKIMS